MGHPSLPIRWLPGDLTGCLFETCQAVSPVHWGYSGWTAEQRDAVRKRALDRIKSATPHVYTWQAIEDETITCP